ncbi:MAG: FmdB family zinc ribbon protein [Acidimicrobiales bacterium]|jgi:putative FmdB family regulatory protein
MPTYEYECQQCHERVEAVQKFSEPSLSVCPLCSGELRKVFSSVGIVFKGSGFYKNDSRATKSTTNETSSTKTDSSVTAAPTTPAAPAAATSSAGSSSTSTD